MKTLPAREAGWPAMHRAPRSPDFRVEPSVAMGASFATVFTGRFHTEIHAKARNF
ncbi:hypothetical protein [Burkholderia cepacia]|uniref:hypothetical protein n=1 Tax=Burkholderia cepacia TaxID=292 RepID=UPI000A619101|nr:hypothetical protein [Burkholderia cepacia]